MIKNTNYIISRVRDIYKTDVAFLLSQRYSTSRLNKICVLPIVSATQENYQTIDLNYTLQLLQRYMHISVISYTHICYVGYKSKNSHENSRRIPPQNNIAVNAQLIILRTIQKPTLINDRRKNITFSGDCSSATAARCFVV